MNPMSAHGRSLRSLLTWGTLLLAALSLAAAFTVVALTTVLHRASLAIKTSTQSVLIAEEAEIDLLLHAQAKSPIVRRNLSGSIQRRLGEAEAYVGTERERRLLDEAKARVLEYVVASREIERPAAEVSELHAAAYSALQELVSINVAQARQEADRAARVDHLANIGGFTIVFLVVGVAASFIYWVRGPLVRPVLDLAQAMSQFGRGDLSSRTRVAGPRELKEMGDRFNEMAAQIERQRDQQRAFLAGVAHDLRNPLSALVLSTEVARCDPSLPPDHPVRRAFDRTSQQLRTMDRMVSDFLDAARIEAGQLELRLELRDVRDIVRSTAELFEKTSPRHELVLSLPPESLQTRVDPLRIEQVAANLISNAIKYSPEGGEVDVQLEPRGDELMLAVSDHGLGMSPEAKARLFEPFRRGLSLGGIPGVGLGLYVARRIVEAHRGRIEVESSLGTGSTFRVFLPAQVAGEASKKGSGSDAMDTGSAGRQPDGANLSPRPDSQSSIA